MNRHEFIFQPGIWVGEGRITFSASPEHLTYYTRWTIDTSEEGEIRVEQRVETIGGDDNVKNNFRVFEAIENAFKIELANELVGVVFGTGVVDATTIAWEFRGGAVLEGFEVYELQENGDYMLHAEYTSTDQFRTIIDGRIWKKST